MTTKTMPPASTLATVLNKSGHEALGPGALRVWLAIDRWCREKGYPPTVRDLLPTVGSSNPNAMNNHLKRLRATGLLRPNPGGARARTLVPEFSQGPDEHTAAIHLRDPKGGDMTEWPQDLRIREFPEVIP